MTLLCPTVDEGFVPRVTADVGAGQEAAQIHGRWQQFLSQYATLGLRQLVFDIEDIVSEARTTANLEPGAIPVDDPTADAAIAFALLLPRSLPLPEVVPEADGEVSFDWAGPSGRMFSASIDRTGRIAYAGRFGNKSRVHGTEQLSQALPIEIVRGITKACS